MSKWRCISRKYVEILASCPQVLLVAALLFVVFCLPAAMRFLSCTQNIYSEVAGSPAAIAREHLRQYFGHEPPECDVILVQQPREGVYLEQPDLLKSGLLAAVTAKTQQFLTDRGFYDVEIDSYVGLEGQGLPNIAAQLISSDKRSSMLVLRRIGVPINKTVGSAENELVSDLRSTFLGNQAAGGHASISYIGVAGIAPFVVDGTKSAARDLARSNPLCIPLCFAVLASVVQSWRLMLITLLCMFCANTLCFAALTWIAESGWIMSTSVPIMSESTLMALTFDYSLFLLVRFQEELALGAGLMQAVSASIRRSGHVILGSGLTLCYCSLAVQQLPLEESHSLSIGILMAILCAMSVNMFVTPVVLLAFPEFLSFGALRGDCMRKENTEEVKHNENASGTIVMAAASRLGVLRQESSRTYDFESNDDENVYISSSDEDQEVGQSLSSRTEGKLRRRALAQQNVSSFWQWWSRVCTTSQCSFCVVGIVIIACIMALTGSTAIHLNLTQVTMDFALLGPEGSQTLETLDRIGQDFSKGIMGPTTVMFVARGVDSLQAERGAIYMPEVWKSMNFMLKFIEKELLDGGRLGSIASPVYLSSHAHSPIEVPANSAKSADETQVSLTTMVQVQELKYILDQMLNAERTASLAMITPDLRMTSPEAIDWTRQLRDIIRVQNANAQSPVDVYMVSQTAAMMDVEEGVFGRVPNLVLFSLIGCLLMMGFLFRSVMIAVRGLVTIVFTLAVVYMAAHCIFQLGALRDLGIPVGGTQGLFFMVPVTTFTIVLGLALDYDIFLLGRMSELRERGFSTLDAVADGVAQTGHVITCAGMMMAIAFGGMILSEVPSMRQASWIFVMAVLLDTFVVRTVVTPALTAAMGELNWWPREFKRPLDDAFAK